MLGVPPNRVKGGSEAIPIFCQETPEPGDRFARGWAPVGLIGGATVRPIPQGREPPPAPIASAIQPIRNPTPPSGVIIPSQRWPVRP